VATRHNFGFLLLDRVSQILRDSETYSLVRNGHEPGLGKWENHSGPQSSILLLWPLTFMNLSGQAVVRLLQLFCDSEISTTDDILIAIDDLSLPLGRTRLRSKGSAGGHNGLKSIEACLGHAQYARLKLGIGRPSTGEDVVDYVLRPFAAEEQVLVEEVLDFIAPEAIRWTQGTEILELLQSVNGWVAPSSRSTEAATPDEGCIVTE
jgi:peptidyl-tRNA hydrolase, PTH1 family